MANKKKKIKIAVGFTGFIFVILLILLLTFLNYHINLSSTTWRCTAWGFIDHSPQSLLDRCYSGLKNWNLVETKDWKVFDDQDYRFVFKYPPNWEYTYAKGTGPDVLTGIMRNNQAGVTFFGVFVPYEQILTQRQQYYTVTDQKELLIDGKRVIRQVINFKAPHGMYSKDESIDVKYFIERGKNHFDGIWLYESDLNPGYRLTDQDIAEFDLMMKTLNFPD